VWRHKKGRPIKKTLLWHQARTTPHLRLQLVLRGCVRARDVGKWLGMVGHATPTLATSFAQSKTAGSEPSGLRTAASPVVADVAASILHATSQHFGDSTSAGSMGQVVGVHNLDAPLQRKPASAPAVDMGHGGRARSMVAQKRTKVVATANSILAVQGARARRARYIPRLRLPATAPPISASAGDASSRLSPTRLASKCGLSTTLSTS
jgi:hypothetical protein